MLKCIKNTENEIDSTVGTWGKNFYRPKAGKLFHVLAASIQATEIPYLSGK